MLASQQRLSAQDDQLLLGRLLEMSHSSPFALQPEQNHVMGKERVKALAMEHQAFTVGENCQALVELCSLPV